MDKATHGRLLARAVGASGHSRDAIALATNRKPRTVTNWTTGATMPSEEEKAMLRELLGPYDVEDPVEAAIRASDLTEDRQDTVLGFFKRQLREQREERAS